MSGMKPPEMSRFFALLRARNRDVGMLAELIGVSRPALTKVLNGSRRWGAIGRRVEPLLTEEEMGLLDVAHHSTWNAKRVAKRPMWTGEKAAACGGVGSASGGGKNPKPGAATPATSKAIAA